MNWHSAFSRHRRSLPLGILLFTIGFIMIAVLNWTILGLLLILAAVLIPITKK